MHACSRNALGLRVAHSYVLYERISEMCFLPAGGAYASGMPRGVNPTTRASAGIFRKDFTFSSLKAKIQEVPNPSLVAATVTFARAMPRSRGYEFMSSQTVRFGAVIISVSGLLFPLGEPSATMLGGRACRSLAGTERIFRQVDTEDLRRFTCSDGVAGRSPSSIGAAAMKPGDSHSECRAHSGADRSRPGRHPAGMPDGDVFLYR